MVSETTCKVPCSAWGTQSSIKVDLWSPDIFKRLFLQVKTQNILCDKQKIFLEWPGSQKGAKIERRIIGVIGNFLFLTSCRSLINEIHQWMWMDGEWPFKATPSHHYFLGFMVSPTAPPHHRMVSVWDFDGACFLLPIRKRTVPWWVILAL